MMLWMPLLKVMMMKKPRKSTEVICRLSIDQIFFFSEELVDQVLNELNITMANQIPSKLSFESYSMNDLLIALLFQRHRMALSVVVLLIRDKANKHKRYRLRMQIQKLAWKHYVEIKLHHQLYKTLLVHWIIECICNLSFLFLSPVYTVFFYPKALIYIILLFEFNIFI